MKALYPGTFDPITVGHLDIIERASKLYEELIVVIMVNPRKQATFSEIQRKKMIEKCTKHLKNVKVEIGTGLTVEYAKKKGAQVLIRGIRAVADYEYELQQATANMMLDDSIETIFLVARAKYSFLSSSVAKEIVANNGDVSQIIPKPILEEVTKKFKTTKKSLK